MLCDDELFVHLITFAKHFLTRMQNALRKKQHTDKKERKTTHCSINAIHLQGNCSRNLTATNNHSRT